MLNHSIQGSSSENSLLTRLKARTPQSTLVNGDLRIVKTSKFLKHPVKSKVTITASKDVITWSMTSPDKVNFIFKNGVITVNDKIMDERASEHLKPLLSMIQSIIRQDWTSIEKSFALSENKNSIRLAPKLDISLKSIEIVFNSKELPEDIIIETKSDVTKMTFMKFIESEI